MLEWIRFLLGAAMLLCGLVLFAIELFGVFRYRYLLNRLHIASIGDTLGIGCCIIGTIILSGWNMVSLKMLGVLLFLWCTSPVASHMLSLMEVSTAEDLEMHMEMQSMEQVAEKQEVEQ